MYDYIIVGGGPTGLTLAYYLSKYGSVILIEKENYLGGCHGVKYVDGYFTEHSPRMYFNSFVNFISVLDDLHLPFYDYFTPYSLTTMSEIKGFIKYLTIKDLILLSLMFIYPFNITLKEYTTHFSDTGRRYLDFVCRKLDGAGIDRFSTHKFVNITNHGILYQSYQPKYSLDNLFSKWKNVLTKQNVKILMETEVINFDKNYVITEQKIIKGSKIIFAIPPQSLVKIVEKSNLPDSFGSIDKLKKWSEATKYNRYIAIVYHWYNKIDIKIPENKMSEWGVDFVLLPFGIGTIISSAITMPPDNIDNYSEEEIKKEVFKQLGLNIPIYDKAIISDMRHPSFVTVPYTNKYLNIQKYPNIYSCGTHSGNSNFDATTIETAITNAIELCNRLTPLNKPIKKRITLLHIVVVLLIILLIFYLIK